VLFVGCIKMSCNCIDLVGSFKEKERKKNRRDVYFAVVASLFQVGVLDGGAAGWPPRPN
jgi:hypothetical protein